MQHQWTRKYGVVVCKLCGVMRAADTPACRGPIRPVLRDNRIKQDEPSTVRVCPKGNGHCLCSVPCQ